ncbi:hypothetical protein LXA43DRAFT_678223 [Ganoderma leucocontextum]|nr:hypothetical protein LXA43DRAFT_678223 [Ganoderma leucocontextum]
MFIHLNIFKRKEEKYEVGYAELTRKNRVEKNPRNPGVRPRTAPGSLELPTQAPESRRSFQYDMQLVAPVHLYAAAQPPTPRDECPRPPMRRTMSSASCVIRNPFRSNTSESVATVAHLPELPTESVDVIHRTVPSHTPKRRTTPPCIAPQRAAIFTRLGSSSDSDETSSDSESPTVPVVVTRSKSLNNGKVSSASRPVRPSLRRFSHEDHFFSSTFSSRRVC